MVIHTIPPVIENLSFTLVLRMTYLCKSASCTHSTLDYSSFSFRRVGRMILVPFTSSQATFVSNRHSHPISQRGEEDYFNPVLCSLFYFDDFTQRLSTFFRAGIAGSYQKL